MKFSVRIGVVTSLIPIQFEFLVKITSTGINNIQCYSDQFFFLFFLGGGGGGGVVIWNGLTSPT